MVRIHEFKIPPKARNLSRRITKEDFERLSRDLKNLLENPVVLASPALLKPIGDAVTEAGKMLRAMRNSRRKREQAKQEGT